jgi:hypothetical protein
VGNPFKEEKCKPCSDARFSIPTTAQDGGVLNL